MGPQGPFLVPTPLGCCGWVGLMVTTHFDLLLGLLLARRGPKMARFGPRYPFWGSWRDSEGPREPGLVPTATGCCA